MNIYSVAKVFVCIFMILEVLSGCSVVNSSSNLVAFLRGDQYPDSYTVGQAKQNSQTVESDGKALNPRSKMAVNRKVKANAKHLKKSQISESDQYQEFDNKTLCSADTSSRFAYRKRIAVLPMALDRQMDAVDLPHLSSQYSRELIRRIDQERFIASEASDNSSLSQLAGEYEAGRTLSPEKIKSAAKSLRAQFIVSGFFWDVSFDRTQFYPINLVSSFHAWKDMGRTVYQNSTGSYLRQMSVEISLYDGATGALIERKQYQGEANHQVEPNGNRFGSTAYWQSDYGIMTANFLEQQSYMIENALACMPMRAQIVATNKNQLEIDVGGDSLLLPGDRLQIFHKMNLNFDWRTDGMPHETLEHIGSLVVKKVYPMKAMAELDSDLPQDVIVQPGDIVQAW